jgi:hypothetical protein
MNIADELQRLADLRKAGNLTDDEFASAKQRLLSEEKGEAGPEAEGKDLPADETYRSSRWSSGNMFFPDSLTLSGDGILFRKGRFFGSSEERINYKAIASVRVKNGVFLSNISVETSGGSQPIFINGLWKSDARRIQDGIRVFQQGA